MISDNAREHSNGESAFILSISGAKIYDLDENPVDVKRWTELPNVMTYYIFFREHEKEFY